MQINEIQNIKFIGANGRQSLLDVIYPVKAAGLPVLVFAHGFKGFKDWGHFPLLTEKIAKTGMVVIRINFSHNGGTEEDPIDFPDLEAFSENTYSIELADLDAVIKWIITDNDLPKGLINKDELFLMGHSRGGSMAILKAAQDSRVKKVISLAAVSDLTKRLPAENELSIWKDEGVRMIENTRTKQKMPIKYQFVEDLYQNEETLKVEKACKVLKKEHLILHGDQDQSVPIEMARDLKKWSSNAVFKVIEGADHTFGGKHPWNSNCLPGESEEVLKHVVDFLK